MKIIILITLALLSGCSASLEDLQAMNPNSRADYICEKHRNVIHLDKRIGATAGLINQTATIISQGYRLVEVCNSVPTPICDYHYGYYACRTIHIPVCETSPVAIDGDLEKEKLDTYRGLLHSMKAEVDKVFNDCFNRVEVMSADAAFNFYESTRDKSIF